VILFLLFERKGMEVIVGITGASGVIIGVRLLEVLSSQGEHEVHLVVTRGAEAVMALELGADVHLPATHRWQADDLSAPIASSSRAPEAMIVAPCSMKTLSGVAHGYANDLMVRAAEIMLRLGRPLVLMPRETPLSLPAIDNLRQAKMAGAIILPPIMAYYPQPQTVDEVTDFFVGKVLDVLGLEHTLYRRWGD
jgi:4-hydroxy-3-polyprenylbenzoate decarboxylase